MAFLIRERGSPYWYIKFRDTDGKWKKKATPYRAGIGSQTQKARDMVAEYSLRERKRPVRVGHEEWGRWVPDYLESLDVGPLTKTRYKDAWEHLIEFLNEKEIFLPRDLEHHHGPDYVAWRKKQKSRGGRLTAHNTAVVELRVLSRIMGEGVRRHFCAANVCREMEVKRQRGREMPDITDEQIKIIRRELKTRPEWMRHAFELAIHHGCRISECRVPMSDIDLDLGIIHFGKTKGGKTLTVPIHPGILPLIEERRKAKAAFLCDLPRTAPKLFHQFFRCIGINGISFHCTRVTVATWLAKSSTVPEKHAMRYMNHSSSLVHRLYQRWRADDLAGVAAAVVPPAESCESPDAPQANPSQASKANGSRDSSESQPAS